MRITFLVFFVLISALSFSQDSAKAKANDSALLAQQEQRSLLQSSADSAQLADSLEQVNLKKQIEQLRSSDQGERAKLQLRLDSLELAKQLRSNRLKSQIDSLRASTRGVPVVFNEDTLFSIYSKLGPFSPSERAHRLSEKLEALGDDPQYAADRLKVFASEDSYDLMYGDLIVLSITERDAFWLDMSRAEAAEHHREVVIKSIEAYREEYGIYKTILRVALILLVGLILYFLVRFLNIGISKLVVRIARSSDKYMRGVKLGEYEFLSPQRELQWAVWALNAFKWVLIVLIVYISLPVIFSIFPTTEGVARTLFGYVTKPFIEMIRGIIGFIPELIAIIVIAVFTRYVVRFLKFLAAEVQNGKLVLNGFYPDWALPTFNLLRVIIYAFAFVIIFPYLPGSDSPVFQGVSVFLGLLISLGSSSAIGNIIAGLVITYMRPFTIGDRVKVGDVTGDVTEKTMLVTRLRTIKNEDVSIPNAAILNGSTINYSSSAAELGLILHTGVTIGYDVPWPKVHELLIGAAAKCELIQKDPAPFVLQTSLDDFYVSYQLNMYTAEAGKGAKIYSEVHANIQDAFNESGVEILSPHYRAQRDGGMVTIPANYLPPDYKAPAFNVKMEKDG